MMGVQIKLLSLPDSGHHAIVIVRGRFDIRSLEIIFANLETRTRQLLDCKILIDLQDAIYDLSPLQIHNFVNGLAADLRLTANKIALISTAETQQFDQIFMLCAFLSNSGFPVSVFHDPKAAVGWLAASGSSKPID